VTGATLPDLALTLRPRRGFAGPGEVDEAPLDVGAHECHAHAIAHVEAFGSPHQLSLHRRPEDADPGSLFGGIACPLSTNSLPLKLSA